METKDKFYLVAEHILPEGIKKTIKVKEMLMTDDRISIQEAVERAGLSRSSFYKYKDYIFPFADASKNKVITLSIILEHKSGVLSSVLNALAKEGGSIITINQGIPLQGVALSTIAIDTRMMDIDLEALFDRIRMIDGVKRLEILGQN